MGKDIEKAAPGPLVVPDFLKGIHGSEGLENARKEDLILPRVSICQSMTPQRKKGNPNYIEGLEEGSWFNNVTNEVYGETIQLIPLVFSKSRIYFKDLTDGGGILCQSFNGVDGGTISKTCDACPNSKFGADGESPACNNFMNFASLLNKQLVAVSFKSSALKAGRQWVTRMKMFDKPAYVQVYELKLVPQKNSKGEFFAPVITFKRWVTEPEAKFAQECYQGIKGQAIKVEQDDVNEEIPF